jgi:hypothetical protein
VPTGVHRRAQVEHPRAREGQKSRGGLICNSIWLDSEFDLVLHTSIWPEGVGWGWQRQAALKEACGGMKEKKR